MSVDPREPAHVQEDALDFAAGRLSEERRAAIALHLAACGECRGAFDFVSALHADLRATDSAHLRPLRIVELSGGAARTAGEERHLAACGSCREEAAWAGRVPSLEMLEAALPPESASSTPTAPGEAERGRTRRERPRAGQGFLVIVRGRLAALQGRLGIAALAGAVAVALLFLLLPRMNDPERAIRALARIAPLPAPQVTRDVEGTESFRAAYTAGLTAYARGDYAGSEAALVRAARLAPAHRDLFLYLGSALLLEGKLAESVRALKTAEANADADHLRAECAWQLANALLETGDAAAAKAALARVIQIGGDHAADAAKLVRTLELRVSSSGR